MTEQPIKTDDLDDTLNAMINASPDTYCGAKGIVIKPTEQPKNCNCIESLHLEGAVLCPDCAEIEQPNQNLMIVKTIQSLMTVVNDNLGKLDELSMGSTKHKVLIRRALEEIDLLERTTLFELQKAFE